MLFGRQDADNTTQATPDEKQNEYVSSITDGTANQTSSANPALPPDDSIFNPTPASNVADSTESTESAPESNVVETPAPTPTPEISETNTAPETPPLVSAENASAETPETPFTPVQTESSDPVDSTTSTGSDDHLVALKQEALDHLTPLVDHLEQSPEEKFRTTMMMIQSTDNQDLIKDAFAAAKEIGDDKARAQALLDVINEINYFTQKNKE